LWFESDDVQLRATPEAFGSALLPAAYARGADLIIDAAVDRRWAENVQALQKIWCRWWGGREAEVRFDGEKSCDTPQAKGRALCFSGGVDSFYTLLRGPVKFDCLVFVHGYDIKLLDQKRVAAAEASVRDIASAVGAKAIIIRTNLREHPAFKSVGWGMAHGGALAAVGHLLHDTVELLVLSASHPYCYDHPWGSHWDTDPLWSSSSLEVMHYGADHWRSDKLREISGESLVREHLRVCWKNLSEQGNCGRCEKCIRTMLILAGEGALENYPVFGGGRSLAQAISNLPPLQPSLVKVYEDFPLDKMDSDVAAELDALIARSRFRRERYLWSVKLSWRRIVNFVRGHKHNRKK
jgi:hypothetical protein